MHTKGRIQFLLRSSIHPAEGELSREARLLEAGDSSKKSSFGSAAKSWGLDLGLESESCRREAGFREIKVSKLLRACGGCLGAKRRRRTWVAAKSSGELPTER